MGRVSVRLSSLSLLVVAGVAVSPAGCNRRQSISPDDSAAGADGASVQDRGAAPPDLSVGDQDPNCPHPAVAKQCSAGWCSIPTGCFFMGSPASEPCRQSTETEHAVTLTRPFQIMALEVSQEQFNKVMGYNPSYFISCGKTS